MNSAFGVPPRGRAFPLSVLTVALATVVLTACGGGGSSGTTAASKNAPSAGTPSAPATSQTPAPPVPPKTRTLAAGAELAPTLAAPQPGSTADNGNASQGVWGDWSGIGFLGADGRFAFNDTSRWIFGSIRIEETNWTFDPVTISVDRFTGEVNLIEGSGNVSPKRLLRGDFTLSGQSSKKSLDRLSYNIANALAVTQKEMAGKWSTSSADGLGMSFTIDAEGQLTGSTAGSKIGECALTGTLLQTEPSTSHNMFAVKFKASNAASDSKNTCQLNQVDEFSGLGAVMFSSVSLYPEEGAYRNLVFHIGSAGGGVMTNTLRRR